MTVKLKRTRITVNMLFAASVTLLFACDKSGSAQICFCAAAFHETGHLLCLYIFNESPEEIYFGFFGMRLVRSENIRLSYLRESAAALAGPIFNLLLAGLLAAVNRIQLLIPIYINVYMALFNLLPILPLDGGTVLYNLLCSRKSQEEAERITKKAAACSIVPLAAFGVMILIRSGYNFTLLAASLYLLFYTFHSEGREAGVDCFKK